MIRDTEIDAQLRRILESSAFISSARSREFLEFCVNRARLGQASQLKETTIAVELFLRAADYDPKSDPIVRVHARRVREKLDLYYKTVGSNDPIKIELPKGGYVPQILRTLPQRKTEFSDWEQPIANVAVEPFTAGRMIAEPDVVPTRSKRNRWPLVGLVAGVALISFTVAWFWRSPAKTREMLGPLQPMELLPENRNISNAAWSPNGRQLAFTAIRSSDRRPQIYLRDVRGEAPSVRLTQDDSSESRPVWSPDGHEIAFIRQIDLSHFEVIRLNLATHQEYSMGRFLTYWPIVDDFPALDWSPDGRYLLTAEQTAPGNPMRIVLVSLVTGKRTFLTSPPIGSSGDIDAKFSPDSKWVAFRRGGLGDLYMVSIQGEQVQPATRLTFDMRGVRGIAWIDQGRSILFGTQRNKTTAYGLWKISMKGGSPQQVSPEDFDAINPAVSSSGVVVLEHRHEVTELMEHTLTGEPFERVLLPSDHTDAAPMYSPDGKMLVFTSTRTGWGELWLYRLGDKAPKQLTHFAGQGLIFLPSWSPDGRSIVFSLRQNGATNVVVYDLASQSLREITSTHNRDISPVYSSDGQFIYYSSNDDGTSRIWRIRADGTGRAEPLFLEAVVGFVPSPDGRWLYFTHDGPELTVLRKSLVDGATEEVFHVPGRLSFFNSLAIANGHIYVGVSRDNSSTSDLFIIDPETKSARVVAHLKDIPPFSDGGFSVSPDGSRLVVGRALRDESSLYMANLTR